MIAESLQSSIKHVGGGFWARGWSCSAAAYAHQVLSKIQFRPLSPLCCCLQAVQLQQHKKNKKKRNSISFSLFVYPACLHRFTPQRLVPWSPLSEGMFKSLLHASESEPLKKNNSLVLVTLFHSHLLTLPARGWRWLGLCVWTLQEHQ